MNVHHHQVRAERFGELGRDSAVLGLTDDPHVRRRLQRLAQASTNRRVVVGKHDTNMGLRIVASPLNAPSLVMHLYDVRRLTGLVVPEPEAFAVSVAPLSALVVVGYAVVCEEDSAEQRGGE